jgi:hypothetical protein
VAGGGIFDRRIIGWRIEAKAHALGGEHRIDLGIIIMAYPVNAQSNEMLKRAHQLGRNQLGLDSFAPVAEKTRASRHRISVALRSLKRKREGSHANSISVCAQ